MPQMVLPVLRDFPRLCTTKMVEFPNGVLGIALNLEDSVGCVLLGDSSLKEGDDTKTTVNSYPSCWYGLAEEWWMR